MALSRIQVIYVAMKLTSSWATAGTQVACYDTEYGRVGLAICFDIHTMLEKYKPHNLWTLLYPIACMINFKELLSEVRGGWKKFVLLVS